MKAPTMLDTIQSLLGTPACAIPLSFCRTARGYLLDKAGISREGTAVIFAVPYVMTADVGDPRRNVSLYAVPRDYHGYMKGLNETLLPALAEAFPAHRFALFADHSPILEVDAAARAGLGVLGLNGLLLTPRYGRFPDSLHSLRFAKGAGHVFPPVLRDAAMGIGRGVYPL